MSINSIYEQQLRAQRPSAPLPARTVVLCGERPNPLEGGIISKVLFSPIPRGALISLLVAGGLFYYSGSVVASGIVYLALRLIYSQLNHERALAEAGTRFDPVAPAVLGAGAESWYYATEKNDDPVLYYMDDGQAMHSSGLVYGW